MGEIVPRAEVAALGDRPRAAGPRIALTNGHFDLLHVGHLRCPRAARSFGDALVVGVPDEHSIRRRKGPPRPIVPDAKQAELLAGLACVDDVTIVGDETAATLVELLRPAVYAKGTDYAPMADEEATGRQPLPEAALVRTFGVDVRTIPVVPGRSTTASKLRRRRG